MYASLNARALGLDAALTAEQTIDLAARHRFGGVDLLVRDLVDAGADLAALRRRIADAGLRPGAWPLAIGWRDSPPEVFAHDLTRLDTYAAAAAALGLTRTGTWVVPESPPGESAEATMDRHAERLAAIARVLDRHGVRLGLEVIGVATSRSGRGTPFLTRLADLGPLLERVRAGAGVPGVGVLVDGFHLHAAGEPVDAALSWGAAGIVWVHVADLPPGPLPDRTSIRDADRGLPGAQPVMATAQLLSRLARAGYDGPVTPEPMAGCRALHGLSPDAAVRRVAEAMNSVWPADQPQG